MEEKEAEIADLKRELQAAKSCSKKTRVVLKDEEESTSRSVRSVSIKLPPFSKSNYY